VSIAPSTSRRHCLSSNMTSTSSLANLPPPNPSPSPSPSPSTTAVLANSSTTPSSSSRSRVYHTCARRAMSATSVSICKRRARRAEVNGSSVRKR
ncbi:hypothetical protein KEM56_004957, partial [Ascosphaera pollenicola]